MQLKHHRVVQNHTFAQFKKSRKIDAKRDSKSHCRRRASPPHPKDTGHLNAKRLNARRWQKLAMLAPKIDKKASQNHQNIIKMAPKIDKKSRLRRRCVFGAFLEANFPKGS